MAENTSQTCVVCRQGNARACGKCQSTKYCSKPCQQKDWPVHKLICSDLTRFYDNSRPEDHVRAVLFLPDAKRPIYIWLPYQRIEDEWTGLSQIPDTERYLKDKADTIWVQTDALSGQSLQDTIGIAVGDRSLMNGSRENAAIASITATQPGRYPRWSGPIVAYGVYGVHESALVAPKLKDLDATDFSHIANFFLTYRVQPPADKVTAVRVNCFGDQAFCRRPPFEAIELDSDHEIFSTHEFPGLAAHIGIPVFTKKVEPDPRWAVTEHSVGGQRSWNNQDATFLHLCCDPKASYDPAIGTLGWGWAPAMWQNHVGSIVVVRQDRKPLSILDVQTLCYYCSHQVQGLFEESVEQHGAGDIAGKEAVLTKINRTKYMQQWEITKRRRQREEGDTRQYISPYGI